MRKSKIPPPPAHFVYLRDVLPALVLPLRDHLRKMGERELADEINDLRIYGRCCNASPCGRFYCLPRDERRKLYRRKQTQAVGLEYIVANGKLVEVETFSPGVDAVLRSIFLEPENGDKSA